MLAGVRAGNAGREGRIPFLHVRAALAGAWLHVALAMPELAAILKKLDISTPKPILAVG